jgi:hypothetical protein
MPRTREDLETYLYRLDRAVDAADHEGGTFLVSSGPGLPPIAVRVAEPIVVVRVDIGPVPKSAEKQNALYRQLLEYNATDLVHAAYALEKNEIVLVAGLELENLDMNEIAAVLSDIDLALARHVGRLRELAAE